MVRAATKSTILSVIVFFVGFFSYMTYRMFFDGTFPPISETLGFSIYHGLLDAAIIWVISYILFKLS